ncbi:MAG: hypothetical protein BMS9Abin07_0834 [Acidimicrobiia bacterium]|nr:MAG: hypothetical protein BMS9Abin07_0834 [Acidimicrobiia bacterium]
MPENLVVVRGGGDLGTGTAWRLNRAGFPVIVLEIPRPLTVRRTVAFSTAVTEGTTVVEDVRAVLVDTPDDAVAASADAVAVLVSETMAQFPTPVSIVVDARLAKQPLDTSRDMAPLVVGLGPGFVAGEHCDAVVETNRGPHLGRVIWEGAAQADTGVPGLVGGVSSARVLRATADGDVVWDVEIGDLVTAHQVLGRIGATRLPAPIAGVVRGLIAPGPVKNGLKIADIDPRAQVAACFEISDKSLSVAGGVLEAVMTWNR